MIDGGGYRPPNSMHIKFKRKGALMAGINLSDAQSTRTRLSGNDAYTLQDLHADRRRRIYLRVRVSASACPRYISLTLLFSGLATHL
jgi:hypothetical protein